MGKTKITYECLVDKYGFKKVVYDPEKTGYDGFEFEKTMDRYCKLVISSDFSFGIESLHNSDGVCFENDILLDCERLEMIWESLTGNKII